MNGHITLYKAVPLSDLLLDRTNRHFLTNQSTEFSSNVVREYLCSGVWSAPSVMLMMSQTLSYDCSITFTVSVAP